MFAKLPEPPYYAVIFSAQRTPGDNSYGAMAEAMSQLAARQPGYLGAESARNADGFGMTVSYWDSEAAILNWKHQAQHMVAQKKGQDAWYAHYEIRVAKVERAYGMR